MLVLRSCLGLRLSATRSHNYHYTLSRFYLSTQSLPQNRNNSDAINQVILDKYAEKIQKKLKEKGLSNLEELKKNNQNQIEKNDVQLKNLYEKLVQEARNKRNNNPTTNDHNGTQKNSSKDGNYSPTTTIKSKSKKYSSPIKPLDSIINLEKLKTESTNEIKKIWTAYHLSTSNPPRLGAVIPTKIYLNMIQLARKYPSFVIPLAKTSPSTQNSNQSEIPFEMQYLQWDFINTPKEPNVTEFLNAVEPIGEESQTTQEVSATIVIYTPLGEYKLRQSFAQPTLILTHYTDLSLSHGIVLMRGDITPSSTGAPKMSTTDAQLLVLRLQQFYYPSSLSTPVPQEKENFIDLTSKRKLLLKKFHETPDQFQLSELLNSVKDL